ncbi:MAG: DUF4296 domain-containing protein [Flavobacterium sp.]|nr:DUF4296 domain-containing protein [Flavobacterium sp.]
MNKFWFFIILIVLLSSCKNSIVEAPDNLIDEDTMTDIFYDLSVLDAAKNSSYGNGTSSFVANDYILKKYKIDSLQFAQSNKYYAADVTKYKRMYKIVRDKLNDKKTEMEAVDKIKP